MNYPTFSTHSEAEDEARKNPGLGLVYYIGRHGFFVIVHRNGEVSRTRMETIDKPE